MAFERGDYDMTLFMCEQSVQLRIKAVLLRLLGYIPKDDPSPPLRAGFRTSGSRVLALW